MELDLLDQKGVARESNRSHQAEKRFARSSYPGQQDDVTIAKRLTGGNHLVDGL
jgi:hypothetical protein